MRYLISFGIVVLTEFLGWYGGMDIFSRSFLPAYWFFLALFLAGCALTYPGCYPGEK